MVGFRQRKSLQGQLQSTVHLFVFLAVVSYNFTINTISQICQQTTAYGHNTQATGVQSVRVTVAKRASLCYFEWRVTESPPLC